MKGIVIHKYRILQLIIFLLFILGLFLPTSLNKEISRKLEYLGWGILLVLFLCYLALQGYYNKIQLLIALGINAVLWVFTLATPLTQYSPGAYFSFFCFSLLICLDLNVPSLNHLFRYILVCCSILLLGGAFMVVFKTINIDEFLVKYYSFGSASTQRFMVDARKPAMMFGTHSIAAFYFFIFFLLNYITLTVFKKSLYLLISILFIVVMILLRSVTGYCFAAISLIIIVNSFLVTPKRALFFSTIAIIVGIWGFIRFKPLWEAIFNLGVVGTFTSSGNGFIGRFSSSSLLSSTIDYIKLHPFQPIGLGYNDKLFYTDSGPVQYFLRGSIFLVVAVYVGAMGLFINNLRKPFWRFLLFFFFLIFEIGYPNFIYIRTLYLIPFIIVYFNYLQEYTDQAIDNDFGKGDRSISV